MPRPGDLNLNEMARDLTGKARDATYVAVGLGVLGVQRMQVHRVALQKHLPEGLEARLGEMRAEVARRANHLDGILEGAMRQVESSLEPVEALLPGPAREMARLAHAGAQEVRTRLLDLLGAE